jgi:hypothetical protein
VHICIEELTTDDFADRVSVVVGVNRTTDSIPHASQVMPHMPCDFFAGETASGDWVGWEQTGHINAKRLVLEVGQPKVLQFSIAQIEAKNVLFDRNTRTKTRKQSDGLESMSHTVEEALCKGILYKDLAGLGRQHAWTPGIKLLKESKYTLLHLVVCDDNKLVTVYIGC